MNRKRILFFILSSCFVTNLFCLTRGTADILHPVSSTNISVNKITINVNYNFTLLKWFFNVDYEFNNPEKEQIQQVEFKSRSDYLDDFVGSVTGFEIQANSVKCDIQHNIEQQNDNTFLEYYRAIIFFQKGVNHVNNVYSFAGSDTGMPNLTGFFMNMKSGNCWRGVLSELSVIIHFDLPILLNSYSNGLNIEGKHRNDTFRDKYEKVVSLEKGDLVLNANNIVQKEDIFLDFYSRGYVMLQEKIGDDLSLYHMHYQLISVDELRKLTKPDLRILRNSIYAWYGYDFKDPLLKQYFNKKCWYWPNKKNVPDFSDTEKQNIKRIIEGEKKN